MITASQFARQYASAWAVLTPMSEEFVRRVNGASCERVYTPVRSKVSRHRRASVNEIAFQLFAKEGRTGRGLGLYEREEEAHKIFRELIENERWARLGNANELNEFEQQEIDNLAQRLRFFFLRDTSVRLRFNPIFSGCGIIDDAFGDVIKGNTLYEVKASGRFFRSVDLRQLLIYSALNKEAGSYEFDEIGMYNPRIGIFYQGKLSEVCYEVSGRSAEELLGDIIERAAGSDISR
jgi:hypothetical protein